jgi:hypothetical protein
VSKKTEKPSKPRKLGKKLNREKNPIKPIKILKKPTDSIWFRFYKPQTEKTGPNPNWKKPEPNRFLSKKPIGLNRFWFFFLIST